MRLTQSEASEFEKSLTRRSEGLWAGNRRLNAVRWQLRFITQAESGKAPQGLCRNPLSELFLPTQFNHPIGRYPELFMRA